MANGLSPPSRADVEQRWTKVIGVVADGNLRVNSAADLLQMHLPLRGKKLWGCTAALPFINGRLDGCSEERHTSAHIFLG
jgi:hypothetical protein